MAAFRPHVRVTVHADEDELATGFWQWNAADRGESEHGPPTRRSHHRRVPWTCGTPARPLIVIPRDRAVLVIPYCEDEAKRRIEGGVRLQETVCELELDAFPHGGEVSRHDQIGLLVVLELVEESIQMPERGAPMTEIAV